MEITNQTASGQLQGNVLFYSRPEPLNPDSHGKLGLRRVDAPFAFAARSQVTPLTVAEFPAAAICFPIIFAGENFQPLAVMGINAESNLFIKADGAFAPIRTSASFICTTITPGSDSYDGAEGGVGRGGGGPSTITRANPEALAARRASRRHL